MHTRYVQGIPGRLEVCFLLHEKLGETVVVMMRERKKEAGGKYTARWIYLHVTAAVYHNVCSDVSENHAAAIAAVKSKW